MKKQVLIIYTGDTIEKVKKYGTGVLQPFDFNHILDHIPEIKWMEVSIDFMEFETPMDSSDITSQRMREVSKYYNREIYEI